MPDMDGFETASHIKRRERTRHVPIIFLTAADRDAQLALRGYAAGAVDYLTKPFDPWVLRAKVSVFVELWTKTQQLAAQSRPVRERDTQWQRLTDAVDEATALLRSDDPAGAATGRCGCSNRPAGAIPPDAGGAAQPVGWSLRIIRALRRPVMSSTRIRKSPTLVSISRLCGVAGLAAEHDQRAQALRVAERHAGQVEHDPRRRVGQHLVDDGRELGGREHVDLTGEAQH